MDKSLPRWAQALGSDPGLMADFDEWVEQRCRAYADEALIHAKSMDELLGYRFIVGELKAQQGMVKWTTEEAQRKQHAFSELAESKPKRRRGGRKRSGG